MRLSHAWNGLNFFTRSRADIYFTRSGADIYVNNPWDHFSFTTPLSRPWSWWSCEILWDSRALWLHRQWPFLIGIHRTNFHKIIIALSPFVPQQLGWRKRSKECSITNEFSEAGEANTRLVNRSKCMPPSSSWKKRIFVSIAEVSIISFVVWRNEMILTSAILTNILFKI